MKKLITFLSLSLTSSGPNGMNRIIVKQTMYTSFVNPNSSSHALGYYMYFMGLHCKAIMYQVCGIVLPVLR